MQKSQKHLVILTQTTKIGVVISFDTTINQSLLTQRVASIFFYKLVQAKAINIKTFQLIVKPKYSVRLRPMEMCCEELTCCYRRLTSWS